MKENEFAITEGRSSELYIQGMAKSLNISLERAREKATQERKKILPNGFESKGHYFYSALINEVLIGFAWVELKGKTAWGYNIYIEEDYRRRGFASEIFKFVEKDLLEKEINQVRFHVYADNFRALPLYEKFGFSTTNVIMSKKIS